jgi:sulfoxide reductase catalytic subunit YedY
MIVPSEITPEAVYLQRRGDQAPGDRGGGGGTGVLGLAAGAGADGRGPGKLAALPGGRSAVAGASTMEKVTEYKDASTYNNFYEFGTDKADPAGTRTRSRPPLDGGGRGLVKKPAKYASRTCSSSAPRRSASTACAASRAGRW